VTITEYLDSVKERLLTDPHVSAFHITRERATAIDGYVRARLTISNNSQLEFSEYVQHSPDDKIEVVTYSYQWADAEGNLIQRWDNTPHFPDLPDFPHHIHDGPAGAVRSGQTMSIFAVLDEIAHRLS
jgi:hypothetical protein